MDGEMDERTNGRGEVRERERIEGFLLLPSFSQVLYCTFWIVLLMVL